MTPRRVVTFLGLLLVLASPAPAGTVRCTTYHKKSLGRWDTTMMTLARPPRRGR